MFFTTAVLAALAGLAAAKDGRTFAVLHHYGNGPLMTGRVDPIISPGQVSSHVHTVMGGSNFGMSATGETLRGSKCTTALIKGDLSAYWFPALYFQDPKDGHFEPVDMYYMNVYYFFEGTNDDIKAFPVGLMMVAGNALTRSPPNHDGTSNLDPSQGPVNPLQWTCPRKSYDPPSYPVGSDGSKAGIVDPNNEGSGIGFPFANCDGYASPLRMDLHFPSCYNPAAGLTNYKNNTAYPSSAGNGKADCPEGWIHTPHIFYEVYWNTPAFADRWTPNQGSQPFVLANGDRSGYSGHGDFIAGWDEPVLQQIIDNCNAGDSGMDKCPGLLGGVNDPSDSCNINSPVNEVISGNLTALPGNNPVSGWGLGAAPVAPAPVASSKSSSTKAATAASSSTHTSSTKATTAASSSTHSTAVLTTDAPVVVGEVTSSHRSTSTTSKTVTDYQTTTTVIASPTDAPGSVNGTESEHPSVAGYTYAGCFKDNSDRVLADIIRPDIGQVSNTLCVTFCKSKGYSLAGTEYAGQCYCGNTLSGSSVLAESECDMACAGDKAQTCGGSWALSVYSTNGKAKLVNKAKRAAHAHRHLHAGKAAAGRS